MSDAHRGGAAVIGMDEPPAGAPGSEAIQADGDGGHAPRRARLHAQRLPTADMVFVAGALAVGVIRLVILTGDGAPPGVDAGNWLGFGKDLLGDFPRPDELLYPPLIPVAITATSWVLGPTLGTALIASLSALLPAGATYLVLRAEVPGWRAVLPAGLLLGASSIGETTAWGGYPQLVGFAAVVLVCWQLDALVRSWSWRRFAVVAGLVFAVLATSHFAAAVAAVAALIIVGANAVVRPWRDLPALVAKLALLALVALPLLPVYLALAAAFAGESGQLANAGFGPADALDQLRFLGRELTWLWMPLLVGTTATPVLLLGARDQLLWRLVTALVAASWVLALVSGEDRFLYALAGTSPLALGAWLGVLAEAEEDLPRWFQRALAGVLGLLTLGAVVAGLDFFRGQQHYYQVLSPQIVDGLDWVRQETGTDSQLAVNRPGPNILGWWVESLTERRTHYAAPLRFLNYDDELDRARFANDLFADGFPDDEDLERARGRGIDLVLVARNTPSAAARLGRTPVDAPVVFENRDLVVLETAASPVGDRS